jgi:putative thiamine transport system permease protein
LIYLPLLVPQVAFLYGLSVTMLGIGLGNGHATVIWGHVLFVFPYVMVALSDPWRALDRRMVGQAAALGAGPWRRLWAVKLPILLSPILVASAVGFAVSVAQYLPTLFLGAGRIATLTTEAVTLSSGSDRRVVGVYAVLQAAMPFAAYLVAWWAPRMMYRDRAGLNGGSA